MTSDPEKPLAGQTVLVTRPLGLADTPLINRLSSAGANVILHPVIVVQEPADWGPVDKALSRLHQFGDRSFHGRFIWGCSEQHEIGQHQPDYQRRDPESGL